MGYEVKKRNKLLVKVLLNNVNHGIALKARENLVAIGASSLCSTVDGSRQGVFWLVGNKKIKNKMCLPANVGGRKK